jgi:hypothetical protein
MMHPQNAIRLVVVLLLVVLMGGLAAAFGRWRPGWLLVAISIAGIFLLHRLDIRLASKHRAKQQTEDQRRLAQPSMQPPAIVEIRGSSFLVLAVFLTTVGAATLYLFFPYPNWIAIAVGALLSAMGGLLLSHAVPALFKPILSISAEGFRTPHTPLISWEHVEGVHLEAIRMRHGSTVYRLIFNIPTLPQVISQCTIFIRIIHHWLPWARKDRLLISLKGTSETPDLIYELAKRYWAARTGRTYVWNPHWSEETNRSQKDLDELHHRMKNMARPGMPPDLAAFEEITSKTSQARVALNREMNRSLRRMHWIYLALTIAFMVGLGGILLRFVGKAFGG